MLSTHTFQFALKILFTKASLDVIEIAGFDKNEDSKIEKEPFQAETMTAGSRQYVKHFGRNSSNNKNGFLVHFYAANWAKSVLASGASPSII